MRKTALLILFSMLLLSAIVFPLTCQALTIGVHVGDWFKYKGTLVSWQGEPGVPIPPNE